VIRQKPLHGAAALPGARNILVLYRSIGVRGKPVAVSGIVTVPKGKAPKGGWPIITWAHGTTGIADQCAPSTDGGRRDPIHGINTYVAPVMEGWLKAGYAIARTDYEGLGTPGAHPYLIGTSEGRSVLDIARAARVIDPRISDRVIIAGHSQGGHAALWAAAIAPKYTPDLIVKGTVAYAPASQLGEQTNLLNVLTAPNPLSALVATILRGVQVGYPMINAGATLSPRAAALYPLTLTQCLGQLSSASEFGGIAPADLAKPYADLSPITAALDKNDPSRRKIPTAVLVEQGLADTTVFPAITASTVMKLKALGDKVIEHTYAGVDHGGIVPAARTDAAAWIAKRLK
jgi:pimeloyl-ACP methyl ester carboxylesterase